MSIAIANKNLLMVETLIDAGAEVNKRCYIRSGAGVENVYFINDEIKNARTLSVEFSPLALAIITQDMDIIKLLINKGAEITSSAKINKIHNDGLPTIQININILELATLIDNLDVFRTLLISYSDRVLTDELHNILLLAGYKNKQKILSLLLNLNIKIKPPREAVFRIFDQEIENPLCEATLGNCYELVYLLLKAGFNQNVSSYHGGVEFINNSKRKAIHIAAEKNHLKIFNLLLENNADINAKDCKGNTPLHLALSKRNYEISSNLIASNADVNISNNQGEYPLYSAIHSSVFDRHLMTNFKNILETLIEKTYNLNKQNNFGSAAIHIASYARNVFTLESLIKSRRVNLNIQNDEGKTALHIAAEAYNDNHIKLLSNANANLNVEDNEGETPVITAANEGNNASVKLLIEVGAEFNSDLIGEILLAHIGYSISDVTKLLNYENPYSTLKDLFIVLTTRCKFVMNNSSFKGLHDDVILKYKQICHKILSCCLESKPETSNLFNVDYILSLIFKYISEFVNANNNEFSAVHKSTVKFCGNDEQEGLVWSEIFQKFFNLEKPCADILSSKLLKSEIFQAKKEFNKLMLDHKVHKDVVDNILLKF